MSTAAPPPVLRPSTGPKRAISAAMLGAAPAVFALARRVWPIPHFRSYYAVTLHDDVREAFGTDQAFGAPYKEQLDVITAQQPFFLGMGDGPDYRRQLAAMELVMRRDDVSALGEAAEAESARLVAASDGRIEVVDLVRQVTFHMLGRYLGVPERPELAAWATRLFEFQFVNHTDKHLLEDVMDFTPKLHRLVDDEIARRKSAPPADDVLGRCLALQAAGKPGYSDIEIRTGLVCMIVGGPPQPPMVVPQAMEQLLRRPKWLQAAQQAALANDDSRLHDIVFEAMRFDPLAPGLPRIALKDWTIARGTPRATRIPKGATLLVAFASAMMDDRRVPDPKRFDPDRRAHEYVHFGYGLHQCFGRHINHATLHRMLKPLLQRSNLRRAPGSAGRLIKNGPFAERLMVHFG